MISVSSPNVVDHGFDLRSDHDTIDKIILALHKTCDFNLSIMQARDIVCPSSCSLCVVYPPSIYEFLLTINASTKAKI